MVFIGTSSILSSYILGGQRSELVPLQWRGINNLLKHLQLLYHCTVVYRELIIYQLGTVFNNPGFWISLISCINTPVQARPLSELFMFPNVLFFPVLEKAQRKHNPGKPAELCHTGPATA